MITPGVTLYKTKITIIIFVTPRNTLNKQYSTLEGTACYAGLLVASADGFGLRPRPFWPSVNPFLAFGKGLELWMGIPSTLHP